MDNELQIIRAGEKVIADRFGMDEAVEHAWDDLEAFRQALIIRIQRLIDDNLERLMHILYRVDVAEEAAQRIFRDSPVAAIAPALADLIIDRQMAKARTRARYREEKEES
jgi:hypothetical protein